MISRRKFGQLLLGAAGSVGAGYAVLKTGIASARERLPWRSIAPTNQKWVMVFDLSKCDGCGDCTKACNQMHYVPPNQNWMNIIERTDNEATGPYFMPRPCMHCDNAPCVRACPVGATFKRTDGIVMMDQDRCIGCRNCIAQCPYSARSFNWTEPPHTAEEMAQPYSMELNYPHRKGVVEKCIMCPSMLREGQLPACATACKDMGAVYFGDELEDAVTNCKGETLRLSTLVKTGAAFRLMEELGTEPRVYYLPPKDRKYPAPDEKREIEKQEKGMSHDNG